MPLTDKERKLLGIEEIQPFVSDKVLPKIKGDQSIAIGENGRKVPARPLLLTVDDVLAPNSPYRKIDSSTGGEIIDTSDLHISQMDTADVRKQLADRIKRGKEVADELTELQNNIDQVVTAAGEFSVQVNIKDINIRQAIMRIFGKRTNIITYAMYKQLLALRERINKEDVNGAMGGLKLGDNLCAD